MTGRSPRALPPGRQAIEDASGASYPEHLRSALVGLPSVPGVYAFHGEGPLPLYIGKSVNIRARVLSHLRNQAEARLWMQTRRISHVPTAGELGALLLEAQMIKVQQPLMNRRLRRTRHLCAFQMRDDVPTLASAQDVDFAQEPDLYGLYRSRRSALDALHALANAHRLCLGMLGLERLVPGRACFRATVRKCGGACVGLESRAEHTGRLMQAMATLRLNCWPYDGAVAIIEERDGVCDYLVVRNWCYLGRAASLEDARRLDRVATAFDVDGYKILCGPILQGRVRVVPLLP